MKDNGRGSKSGQEETSGCSSSLISVIEVEEPWEERDSDHCVNLRKSET
jgi:hypothetical protein